MVIIRFHSQNLEIALGFDVPENVLHGSINVAP